MCYYFVLEKLHAVCFSNHYHSFEVIKHVPKEFFICKPSDLFDHAVLGLYHIIPQCHFISSIYDNIKSQSKFHYKVIIMKKAFCFALVEAHQHVVIKPKGH